MFCQLRKGARRCVAPRPTASPTSASLFFLSCSPLSRAFAISQDLSYTVKNRAHKKNDPDAPARLALLAGVTMCLQPGELAALVGPSGSRKSTLLDVLAGRKTVGSTTGLIRYAGTAPTTAFLRRYTGYVEQDDTLIPNLTVAEMIAYTAALKVPVTTSKADRAARVGAVIDQLALAGCRGVRIGSVLARGISGGQAKRTNIALALVSRPKVLFLDEPTSGLDSYTSNKVMDIVAGLAKSGLTVCATVHSPTSHIYSLFDRLTMLAAGRVLWSGPAGGEPITFLEGALPGVPRFLAGGSPDAPQGAGQAAVVTDNAAEWLVDVTTAADRDGQAGSLADAFAASPAAAAASKEVEALLASNRPPLPAAATKALATKSATTTPWFWGVWTLLTHRGARDLRDPEFLGPRIGDSEYHIWRGWWAVSGRGSARPFFHQKNPLLPLHHFFSFRNLRGRPDCGPLLPTGDKGRRRERCAVCWGGEGRARGAWSPQRSAS